jgi:hypothetical protein
MRNSSRFILLESIVNSKKYLKSYKSQLNDETSDKLVYIKVYNKQEIEKESNSE